MDVHENARMTPRSRMVMMERLEAGWTVGAVASAFGIDGKTVRKWRGRYRREGATGLKDRSSRPHCSPSRLTTAAEAEIETLRRRRLSGPVIARRLGRPVSTVGRVLRRLGLGRLRALDPAVPVIRYEREKAGELIHIDSKKLGRIDGIGHRITGDRTGQSNKRGTGWEALHVAIDDASRLAYTEILPDEKKTSATAFLERALVFFARHGVTVERVMTDNGSPYRSAIHAIACHTLGIRHLRTRPYRPQTNGKAERFIRTMLGGWAYGAIYRNSAERTAALEGWLWRYNFRRPHGSLGRRPPAARLAELNNALGSYT